MEKEKVRSGNIIDFKILSRILDYVKPYRGSFYIVIGLTLLLGIVTPIRPFLIQYTLDEHVQYANYWGMVIVMGVILILLFLQAIMQYTHTYLSGKIAQYVIRDLRIKLYTHLVGLRLRFFDKTPIGRLITRTISDIETLADVFSEGLAAMASDLLQIGFILAFMLYSDWRLTVVSLSTIPFMFLATYIFKEKIKIAFNDVRNAVSNLNAFVQEHITGMTIVQVFGSEKKELDKFKEINKEHRSAHLRSVLYYSVYFPVAEIIAAMGTGLLIWYGAKGVIHQEFTQISLGKLVSFIMYIQLFFRPIRMIADRYNTLQMGIVGSSRIIHLLDDQTDAVKNGKHVPQEIKGEVSFEHVWFAYEGTDYVLKDVHFKIRSGETVALVGATGAGKSSIINLLNRFYEINQGSIKIDNVDIQDYDLTVMRRKIGVVLQDVFLFSNTIRNNITLGSKEITEEIIWKAVDLVGARKFIECLPGGLEYNVMERGATLSVGQRQLISFIRAMVYDPAILILDEATSSVDTETEEMIQQAVAKIMINRTSIVIAHRLSTIKKANQILVLEKGRITETGKHDELLDRNGTYAQLHKIQYKD